MIKLKGLPENNNTKRRSTKEYKRFDRDNPLGHWVMPENFQLDEIAGQSGNKIYRIGYKVRPWRVIFYIAWGIICIMCIFLYFMSGNRYTRRYDNLEERATLVRYFLSGAGVSVIASYFAFISLHLDVTPQEFKVGYGMRIPWLFTKTIIRDQALRLEVTENEKFNLLDTASALLNGDQRTIYRIYYVRNDQRIFLMKVKSETELSTYQSFFEELIHVGF